LYLYSNGQIHLNTACKPENLERFGFDAFIQIHTIESIGMVSLNPLKLLITLETLKKGDEKDHIIITPS